MQKSFITLAPVPKQQQQQKENYNCIQVTYFWMQPIINSAKKVLQHWLRSHNNKKQLQLHQITQPIIECNLQSTKCKKIISLGPVPQQRQ